MFFTSTLKIELYVKISRLLSYDMMAYGLKVDTENLVYEVDIAKIRAGTWILTLTLKSFSVVMKLNFWVAVLNFDLNNSTRSKNEIKNVVKTKAKKV